MNDRQSSHLPYAHKLFAYCLTKIDHLSFSWSTDPASPLGHITWHQILSILTAAASAVAFLHALDFFHGDVRSPNIRLDPVDATRQPKIVGNILVSCVDAYNIASGTAAAVAAEGNVALGTVRWSAPEVLALRRPCKSGDVWAFGIMLLECYMRKRPFFAITDSYLTINLVNPRTDENLDLKIPDDCPGVLWGNCFVLFTRAECTQMCLDQYVLQGIFLHSYALYD